VVLGYANAVATEVDLAACDAESIAVLRRCSGGGTVLQGPGCLNYSLVLNIDDRPPLRSIASANRFIMEQNRAAIERALSDKSKIKNQKSKIEVSGHTDLTCDGRKFSGNSQRRRKKTLLFHGTFLLQFDLSRIEKFLPMPAKQPAYRQNRSHADFLRNLQLPADSVKAALRAAWHTTDPPKSIPREAIASLAHDKYATRDWNFKF
jgi:lipoate-protein ligase A